MALLGGACASFCSQDLHPRSDRGKRTVESPCAEGCESNLWPRLIVGVLPSPTKEVRVRIRDQKGALFEGNREGCPEAPGIVCSYSFFTNPSDRSVTLLIEPATGMGYPARAEIALGAFNYCGREIAYVLVTLVPGSLPQIGRPRLVSPCERPPEFDRTVPH